MALNRVVLVRRQVGQSSVGLKLEDGEGTMFLSVRSYPGTPEYQREVVFLTEIHLELYMSSILHNVGLCRGHEGRQHIDMVSMESGQARKHLSFVYDSILAEAADVLH